LLLELDDPILMRSLRLTRAQAAAMQRRLDDDDGMRLLECCEEGKKAS
jgi:hypothetical protein